MSKPYKDEEDGIMRGIVGGWVLMGLGGIMMIAAVWSREWEHFFSGIAVAIIGKFFCNKGWDEIGELKDINFKEMFSMEKPKLPKEEALKQLKLAFRGVSIIFVLCSIVLWTDGYIKDTIFTSIFGIFCFIFAIKFWITSNRIN